MKREAPPSPARALRDHVIATHCEGDGITVATDASSYRNQVLVAVRVAGVACVIAVDRAEYDGFKLLEILGLRNEPAPIPKPPVKKPQQRQQGTR